MRYRPLGSALAGLGLVLAVAAPAAAATTTPLRVRGWVEGEVPRGSRLLLTPSLTRHRVALLLLDGRSRPRPDAETEVAPDGSFAVPVPAPGMWRLDLELPGRVPLRRDVEPLLGPLDLPPVEPPPAADLTVRVVDAAGAPVDGARVWVADHEPGPWRPVRAAGWFPAPRVAFSDGDGVARLPVLTGERPVVRAWAAGSRPSARREVDGEDLVVTLRAAASRAVTVRDPAGRPLPEVVLRSDGVAVARTNAGGRAAVGPVAADGPEGTVTLELDGGGGRVARVALPPEDPGEDGDGAVSLVLPPATVISGSVTDEATGTPVGGAFVWPQGHAGASVVSGDDGSFELALPPAAREVHAAAVGYDAGVAELGETPPAQPLALALASAAPLAGRVVDGDGAPLAATVIAVRPVAEEARWPWPIVPGRWRATSGPDGRFHLGGLERKVAYRLRAERPGLAPAERTVRAGQVGLELVLRSGSILSGRIAGPEGRPRTGVRVALVGPLADVASSGTQRGPVLADVETVSDDEGRFRVPHLEGGLYDLTAVADGLAPRRVPGIEVPPGPQVVELGTLRLGSGVDLTGVVVDARGEPLADVEVLLDRGNGVPRRLDRYASGRVTPESVTTDADGRFRFTGFNEGDPYFLATQHPWRLRQRPWGEVLEDESLRLVVAPGARIEGSVVDAAGAPVGRAVVMVRVQGDGEAAGSSASGAAMSGEGGAWSVDGMPPGEATVAVNAGKRGAALLSGVRLSAGESSGPWRLELEPAVTVEGRVLDADGTPLAGIAVHAGSDDRGLRISGARTDGAGRFRLDGLPAGRLSVAVAPHAGLAVEPVEVWLDGGSAWVELRADTRALRGRVVDDEGRPVPGAELDVQWTGERTSSGRSGERSGPDGRFAIPNPRPGRYELTARFDGLVGTAVVDYAPGAPLGPPQELEVRLREPDGSALVGELLGVAAERLALVEVTAFPEAGGRGLRGQVRHDGRYRIAGLRPGRWSVVAEIPVEGRRATAIVDLAPGEDEVERDLDLDPPGSSRLAGRLIVDGEPFGDGSVELRPTAAGPGARERYVSQLTDGGSFRITGPAGTYDLVLSSWSGLVAPVPLRRVELAGIETEITLEVTTVAVQGRVVDGAGRPVAGARVGLGFFGQGGVGQRQPATTGPDGGFRIDRVVPGSYLVAAWRGDGGPIRTDFVPLQVVPGGVRDLELRLAR